MAWFERDASVLPASVMAFRVRYRQQEIGRYYRGWLHAGFTFVIGGMVMLLAMIQLQAVSWQEWLTLPLTFVYANLAEYWGHRGPMHHRRRGLGLIFLRHTQQHHRFFTDQAMAFQDTRDFKAVLFPPALLVFFLLVFALPVGLLLAWLASTNVAWLFVLTAVGYFLNYECFHFLWHLPEQHPLLQLPGMAALRRLHLAHHHPQLMQHYNFNITYPIADWLFGSWYRAPLPATSDEPAQQDPNKLDPEKPD